jgi:thioredoxin 1
MEMQEFVKHADDGTFESFVIKADKPTLVDFWAPWCGPCRAIAPVLEELAKEYADRVNVVKVNVDESPRTSSQYGVRSIPTLHLFREGEIRETRVGLMKKDQLSALIDGNL